VYIAFSPPELLPASSREKLDGLMKQLPSIVELSAAPKSPPSVQDLGSPAVDGSTLNFPLAYAWLKSQPRRAEFQRYLDPLLKDGAK
jgi:hypothetical protein